MFIEAVILGFIVGIIRKGRFANISCIFIKGTLFIILGIVLQIMPIVLGKFGIFKSYYGWMSFAGMLSIMIALLRNLDKKGLWIVSIGAALNLLVVGLSGFAMPVSFHALDLAGLKPLADTIADGSVINYVDASKLSGIVPYLGKMIPLPKPYPLAKVLSLGDLIMTVGVFWFIQAEFCGKRYLMNSGRMIRYTR